MNVRDIAGILSRPFIVGYFTPALIAWTTIDLLTRGGHPGRFDSVSLEGQVLVVVILALGAAALLSTLRYEIRLAFTQAGLLPGRLRERLREREQRRFAAYDPGDPVGLAERDVRFPDTIDGIRPTRLGNAEAAYQAYPATRFGLDYRVAWKRIDVLLSAREVELQALARSDVDVFLNLSVLALLAAPTILIERLVYPSPVAAAAVGIFLASPVFYRLAVGKEQRLGAEQRASFDVHRLELYEKFGLRRPDSPEHEKLSAQWLSTIMLWPEFDLPRELWEASEAQAEKPPGSDIVKT